MRKMNVQVPLRIIFTYSKPDRHTQNGPDADSNSLHTGLLHANFLKGLIGLGIARLLLVGIW